jgi:hypothetical protein
MPWVGRHGGIERRWLRWYDRRGEWVPADTERERQRAERAERRSARERQRAELLRGQGIDPDALD